MGKNRRSKEREKKHFKETDFGRLKISGQTTMDGFE
jgi:hypothetical protein